MENTYNNKNRINNVLNILLLIFVIYVLIGLFFNTFTVLNTNEVQKGINETVGIYIKEKYKESNYDININSTDDKNKYLLYVKFKGDQDDKVLMYNESKITDVTDKIKEAQRSLVTFDNPKFKEIYLKDEEVVYGKDIPLSNNLVSNYLRTFIGKDNIKDVKAVFADVLYKDNDRIDLYKNKKHIIVNGKTIINEFKDFDVINEILSKNKILAKNADNVAFITYNNVDYLIFINAQNDAVEMIKKENRNISTPYFSKTEHITLLRNYLGLNTTA